MDPAHGPQAASEALSDAARPANDVPYRRHQRAVLADGPQPQVPEPSTLDETGPHQLLQGALHRVRVRLDASRDLAGMKLLPGRAHQQG